MTKIVWLLKKAEHLTHEEFRDWWLNSHAPHARTAPGLKRYVINVARPVDDLAGRPTWACEWDGVAEQWFDDDDALNAAYSRPVSGEIRADTMAHVARLERLIVHELDIEPAPDLD
ncbi:MAG: EthD domain-containing protein [Phycisphaerales bacterium]